MRRNFRIADAVFEVENETARFANSFVKFHFAISKSKFIYKSYLQSFFPKYLSPPFIHRPMMFHKGAIHILRTDSRREGGFDEKRMGRA